MILRVGIENNNDGRTIAWALEHPGCYAYGRNSEEAQRNMQQAAPEYAAWLGRNGGRWLPDEPLQVRVDETFDAYIIHFDPDLEPEPRPDVQIESFFLYDQEPLTATDIEHACLLLEWTRRDLLAVLQGLSKEKLEQAYPGERWNINGILRHIAASEWWYQERIGAPYPEREEDLPQDAMQCLGLVRAHFEELLPKLENVQQLVNGDGELWSPRKVLRRALWHERDHTGHIQKLL